VNSRISTRVRAENAPASSFTRRMRGSGPATNAFIGVPLARLIAHSALEREESRGAHQRSDRPETDPALDEKHLLVGDGNGSAEWEVWG